MRYTLLLFLVFQCLVSAGQKTASTDLSLTLPPVALVDIMPTVGNNVTLTMTAPTEAGNAVGTGTSNATNWLVLTSAVATGASRSIRGNISGVLPAGVKLRLNVAAYAGSGQGFTGGLSAVTSPVYLSVAPSTIISNIHGAYTGITAGSGFRLTYTLEIDAYTNIRSGTSNVTVIYTITDN